jgi:6-phosphogluconolactonase (cycloisomerase 2 family)
MKPGTTTQILTLMLVLGLALVLAACSAGSCASNSGGSGSSGGPGGTSGGSPGDNTCSTHGGGGGGGGGGGSFAALLYYMDSSTTQIDGAGLSSSGQLSAISSFTPPTIPANSSDNMVIVNKQFLYIPMSDTTVQGFTIDHSSGALTAISGSPFTLPNPGSGTADGAVADAKGRFLFVGSEFSGQVWVFQINASTGALTAVSGSPFTSPLNTFTSADSLTVDAGGQFLYVGQGSVSAGVEAFSIDQTSGALAEVAGSPFLLGVAEVHADPAAEFLLGVAEIPDQATGATDTHISVFSIANNGVPSAVAGSPFTTTNAPYDFFVVPNGNFVFAFGFDSTTKAIGSMEGFQMDPTTGELKEMSGSPFTSLPTVFDCQIDQGGSEAICFDNFPGGTTFTVLNVNSSTGAVGPSGTGFTVNNTFPFAITD